MKTRSLATLLLPALAGLLVIFVVARSLLGDDAASNGQAARPEATAALPTAGPGAEERDARRLQDVVLIRKALDDYKAAEGSFPSTNNRVQTVCRFPEIDAGCRLRSYLSEIPTDPLGLDFGYLLLSDGNTAMLISRWEGGNRPAQFACPQGFSIPGNVHALICLR